MNEASHDHLQPTSENSVDQLRKPAVIRSRDDFVGAMRRRRTELGWTCLELDHRAGFHDGYMSHLEHPERRTGRGSLSLSAMAAIWLQTLGLELVLRHVSPESSRSPSTHKLRTCALRCCCDESSIESSL